MIGYGGGKQFTLGDILIEPGETLQDGWCAISLVAMDSPDTRTMDSAPRRWLLTATGYADNTGLDWKNAKKSTVGRDWGRAPSRVEGVPVVVKMETDSLRAWALNERGQRKSEVTVTHPAPGVRGASIGRAWQTLWYELEAR